MDGKSRSRGWDKEVPHGVLPMEQLVLSDKWARIYLSHTPVSALGKDKNRTATRRPHADYTSISDVIVMLKRRHHVASQRMEDLIMFLNIKCGTMWWARKRIHYSCEGGIEKFVPRDHRLSSLSKPRDANR